jgi:hypothetical protein
MTPKVIVSILRRPKSRREDPHEMRTDPLWEFGSFGCTSCHKKNLMNPDKIHFLEGVRLAFARGGDHGFKLVHLSPSVEPVDHGSFAELKWHPVTMPFKYARAPLLINNDGESDFPLLKSFIANTNRPTWESKFASKFRSRRKPVEPEIADEMVDVFEQLSILGQPDMFASTYVEALPYPPPNVDRNRRQTYLGLVS